MKPSRCVFGVASALVFACVFQMIFTNGTAVNAGGDEPPSPSSGFGGGAGFGPVAVNAESNLEIVLQNAASTVLRKKGSKTYAACSVEAGGWDFWACPEGVNATLVASANVVTFALSGGPVRELVAFSYKTGKWHVCPLVNPVETPCEPLVSAGLACFQVGGNVYAFSPENGNWDSVSAVQPVSVSTDHAMVHDQDRVAMFSPRTGRWDVVASNQLGN